MPYQRPTLTAEIAQAKQDVQSAGVPGVNGLLDPSVLITLSYAMAGLSYGHYGYQDWISRQATPWDATDEYAEGWGALKSIYRKAAIGSVCIASFTGQPGVLLPAGSAVVSSGGTQFVTLADATVTATQSLSVTIQAQSVGAASNLPTGASVSLGSPISGINSAGTITSTVTAGADEETADDFKTRYLAAYATPGKNGNASDYVEWAEQIPGITRAWVNPLGFGPGSVVLYIMLDTANAPNGGFPDGSDGSATGESRYTTATGNQLQVANALYTQRPVTALLIVCAPKPFPVNFTIRLDDAPAGVSSAITAALQDMMLTAGDPTGSILDQSDWDDAIRTVPGIGRFGVVSPVGPLSIPLGSLPTVGNVDITT